MVRGVIFAETLARDDVVLLFFMFFPLAVLKKIQKKTQQNTAAVEGEEEAEVRGIVTGG